MLRRFAGRIFWLMDHNQGGFVSRAFRILADAARGRDAVSPICRRPAPERIAVRWRGPRLPRDLSIRIEVPGLMP